MATEAKSGHEWVEFQRVHGYDEDHGGPLETKARWCGLCGTLDLGEVDGRAGRFYTLKGIRQVEPECGAASTDRIADALEHIVETFENGLGLPVALYQSDHERPIRVRVGEGDVEPDER